MARRRRIALIGLAAASLMLATGSRAFTSTSADREISVEVVEDGEAYLAFPDEELKCGNPQGGPQKNTIVRNQLGTSLSVTVEVSVSGGDLRIGESNPGSGQGQLEQLSPGEEETLTYHLGTGQEAAVFIKPPSQGNNNQTVDTADTVHVETVAVRSGIKISASERDFEFRKPNSNGNCPSAN
jgi:hypothetical protein